MPPSKLFCCCNWIFPYWLIGWRGFPEPFFKGNATSADRWSMQYSHRLIAEVITGLENVHDVSTLEVLLSRLPDLVGSPLSVNSLREDLQVNHGTVTRWLEIFERTYAIFRIAPLGAPRIRAVKKEQKHYHFDMSVENIHVAPAITFLQSLI